MKVIVKGHIPTYDQKCDYCNSLLRYTISDVHNMHIICPVCNMSLWANGTCVIDTDEEGKE